LEDVGLEVFAAGEVGAGFGWKVREYPPGLLIRED